MVLSKPGWHGAPNMKGKRQAVLYSVRNDWKGLTQAELLGVFAIGGYLIFLPLETRPDLATLILVAFGLLAISYQGGLRPRLERMDYLIITAVVAATGLSALFSVEPARGLRFLVYLCLNMFLLLLASAMANRNLVKVLAFIIGGFGVLHLLALLLSSQATGAEGAASLVDYPQMSTLIVPNDALILGLCLPFLAFLLLDDDLRGSLVGYSMLGLYAALSMYVSYQLQSKLTLLSVLTVLLVLTAARILLKWNQRLAKHHLALFTCTFGLLLSLGAVAWYLGNQSTTRLSLWSEASTAHTTVPEVLFGAGPNTFLYNPFTAESGFDKGDLVIPWAHNLYLEAYFDEGLFGLLAILALTVIPVLRAFRIKDNRARALILTSMVTFFLVALFEVTLTRRFYFAFLALLYGLSIAQTQEVENVQTN